MKVLILSNSSWNLFNFRLNLIKFLISKKYNVLIIAPEDKYTKKLIKIGCNFKNINLNDRSVSIISNIKILIEYYFNIKAIKPDIILTFTIKPNIYGSIISRILKVKTINTITGLGSAFIKRNFLYNFICFLYKISLHKSNLIFFQNDEDKTVFKNNRILYLQKYKIIPGSGVDLKKYNYSKFKRKNNVINFTYIGRLIYEKGIGELIESIKEIKLKKINVNFTIIGSCSNNNKIGPDLSYINTLSSKGFFKYIPFTDDVIDHILKTDCIILPSYREGTSKIILEAGALGTPVIGSDVPGINNIIKNEKTGFLFLPKNVNSLTKNIIKFMNLSENDVSKISNNLRMKIEKNFDENIVINEYDKAISS